MLGLLLELGDNASNDIEHCASNVQTMAKWIDDDEDDLQRTIEHYLFVG